MPSRDLLRSEKHKLRDTSTVKPKLGLQGAASLPADHGDWDLSKWRNSSERKDSNDWMNLFYRCKGVAWAQNRVVEVQQLENVLALGSWHPGIVAEDWAGTAQGGMVRRNRELEFGAEL